MKRLFLISLFLLLSVMAWADVYPIGALGTSSSATYGPISGYYDYGWTKAIVTASEMTAAGYDGSDDMTGLGYYVGNTPSNYQIINVYCYIRHTTLSAYTTTADETGTAKPDSTLFTNVFSGTLSFNGGGWHYFAFNMADFDWDGTSNIEIFWMNLDGDYVTGYPTYRYASTSPDYKLVYKQQDTTWPTTAGTRITSRSNIAIVTPSTDPPNPAILVYPADGGYAFLDANLSWSDGGGMPTSYDVYLDTVDPPVALVADDVTTTSFTPTLSPGTTYYWQVIPRNTNGEAPGCPIWSFTTPGTNQLAESFDATTFPPVGWENPGSFTRTTTTPFYGAANIYKSASTTPALISTPILAIDTDSDLDFYYRTSSTTGYGLLNIKYSTDRVTWNQIGATIPMPTTTTWNHANVALGAIPAGNYFLGFEVSTSNSTSSIYIDYIFGPNLAAVAPGPVALTAPADAATNVSEFPTFTWTAPTTGGVPTGYKIYCDTTSDPSTMLGTVTALTFTATEALPFNTLLYWKVVAFNGTGDSTGNPIRSFTTREDPTIYTMPWLEDFGTTGATFPPTNWTRWSGLLTPEPVSLSSVTSYWVIDDYANIVTDPTNKSASMNIYSTTRKHWLMTPPIQMPGTGYQLEFDLALTDDVNAAPPIDPTGYTGVDDKFAVLISDGSTWSTANAVKIWDNDAATSGGIYEVYNDVPHTGSHWILPLDSYTGIKQIAFYGESTVSNADNDFFVDNVMIRQTPAGAPEHVTLAYPVDGASGVIPESTTISWTASLTGGIPAYYEVYVGGAPIDPSSDYYGEYFYETADTSLNLSAQADIDLGYSTTWYWAILPYNSDGLSPDPLDPAFMVWDFTTIADPTIVALPHEEYFDDVTAPTLPYGWTNYINSTSTSAVVATYSSTTYAQSAPNSVRLYNPSDASADLRLITPVINSSIPVNTIKIKFYARSSSAGYPLLVGTVSAPDGSGVFTQMQQIDLTATKTEYDVSFANYLGTDQYICFKHGLGGTGRTLYVDNVRLLELLPVDLAATGITGPNILEAGNSYDYVVSVFNEGTTTVNSYSLNLKQADGTLLTSTAIATPLDPAATAQITIPWIPATGGVYQVYGEVVAAGDGNAANDESALKSVYVLDNSMTLIPLGNDATTTSGYYLPFGFYHKNSVGEALYFPDETHLQSGTISAIAFKNTFSSTTVLNKPVKIWMAHTTVTDLTGGWLPAADYTLVFDGNVDFPAGVNYIPIPLTTPFNYTGGTLAVRFNRPMDTGFYTTSDKFYYTTTPEHTNRGRYLVNDSTVYDPMDPSATGTAVGYLPNTTFVVQNAVMQTGAVLSGHVYETGGTTPIAGATVTLSDERYSTTTNAEGYYEFTFWEAHTVTAVASKATYYSQTVTGLNLTIGNTITQNFILGTMPRVTVSGIVNTNDVPGGIEGAAIALNGSEVYNVVSGANGLFSIPNVLGSNAGQAYTITITKDGYQGYSAAVTVLEANLDLGTITLVEHLWTAYNLVASHNAGNADLTWDAAAEPDYFLFDFEADNGGWVPSSNWTNPLGDWEWANTYPTGGTFNWTDSATSCVPPTAAHSGTGLWGTKLYTNYSMSGGWSYLTREVNLGGFANPQLRFWRWNNLYYTYDYYYVQVSTDGTNWTNVLSETTINNAWAEKVVDLSTYANQTISIRFAMYATTVVSYAGLYIDDIYIGPASSAPALAGRNQDRSFQNYSLYRLLAADEATPASWSLLSSALTDTVYTDNGFGAVPGGTYEWAVKANYSGSQSSEPIFSNTLGRVYNPADIAATTVGATVQLSWTAEPGATFYKIYAADDPYGVFTYLGYSQTATYSVALPAAKKFYKVTAVADEALPAGMPALNAK